MAWLEGAIRKEITRHRTPMERYDAVVNHIAVSEAASLFGYFDQVGNPTSHFYVRKTGPQGTGAGMADYEQYVDTQFRAPAQLEGNHRCISIETQGGKGADLDAGWTVAQVNRLAWIAAECHRLHGIPLQPMPDSLPTSRGIGYHRLGVDPWRVDGGELWSKSYGKVCPGPARILQIPGIITRAQQSEEDMSLTEADGDLVASRLLAHLASNDKTVNDLLVTSYNRLGWLNSLFVEGGGVETDLDQLAVVLAKVATPFDYDALAAAIVAKLPPGQLDQAAAVAAVKQALREGVGS